MLLVVLLCGALLLWIAYLFYKFSSFKSKLMNEFGRQGVSYSEADKIYAERSGEINGLHHDGISPHLIVKKILDQMSDTSPTESADSPDSDERLSQLFDETKLHVESMGYRLTQEGALFALLSIANDFTPAETAMQVALVTFARDAKAIGNHALHMMTMSFHAREIMNYLHEQTQKGLVKEDYFKNDCGALMKIAIPSEQSAVWADKV